MESPAVALSRALARNAEAVCRHYLGNGRRSGRYWIVGDTANSRGRSLFVRLTGGPDAGPGAAGKWQDAATGEHGDLLDLIAANRGLRRLADVLAEARGFLNLPQRPALTSTPARTRDTTEAARRLWAAGVPIAGTLAETYLRNRAIATTGDLSALRFHPRCYWVSADGRDHRALPAMLAAVTDIEGRFTGLQRTWLAAHGTKANLDPPRRAMGKLLGNAVRFGRTETVVVVSEGIETALSLRTLMPHLPCMAALSAAHLERIDLPPGLKRLCIAVDKDPAGFLATERLQARARRCGLEVNLLFPRLGDWNDDLRETGLAACNATLNDFLPAIAPC